MYIWGTFQFSMVEKDLGQDEFVTEVYLVNIKAQTRLYKFEIRVGKLIHIQ